ncbi:MAG: Cys-tRNA(Pro) deacylase [Mucinivorans sp.]
MAKTNKTNVARLLDKARIGYELVLYTVDENDLGAKHIAQELNENIEQVFKTLVLKGDRNSYFVCVIPADKELNLKSAAKLSGNKSAELIAMKELLPTTGYVRGGCCPIGMKREFPTFFHHSCLDFDYIYVSGGTRGVQLKIAGQALVNFVKARVEDLL